MAYIRMENLQFLDILQYPSIEIEQGEFCFVVGKSGCGKSTLLKMLARVCKKSGGEIFFEGKNIREIPPLEYRKSVCLSTQEVFLHDCSILENFHKIARMRGDTPATNEFIEKILRICVADFPLETQTTTLSGGERSRVFLAIALSFLPKVLLLDEPTSALDEGTAEKLIGNLKKFCKLENITVLVVCHSALLCKKFASHTIAIPNEDMEVER